MVGHLPSTTAECTGQEHSLECNPYIPTFLPPGGVKRLLEELLIVKAMPYYCVIVYRHERRSAGAQLPPFPPIPTPVWGLTTRYQYRISPGCVGDISRLLHRAMPTALITLVLQECLVLP